MKMEKNIGELMKAIQNVQQKATAIKKNSSGQVGSRTYKYANLNDTWESIKSLLKDNNLVVFSAPVSSTDTLNAGNYFKTTIYHTESDQYITEYMPMTLTKNDPQGVGAAITYYRRYMIQTMLGIIPDDDNDAREQRLATADQKLKIVGAVRLTFGDELRPEQINDTIENIIGKHPSFIHEDEADNVISLIKAYKA